MVHSLNVFLKMRMGYDTHTAPPQTYRRGHVQRAHCQLKLTVDGTKQYIPFQQNNTQYKYSFQQIHYL